LRIGRSWSIGFVVVGIVVVGSVYIWLVSSGDDLPEGLYFGNGRIEGIEVKISTKYPGRIIEIGPQEGGDVEANEIVVRLDNREARAGLASAWAERDRAAHLLHSARAEIERRESDVNLVESQLNRTRRLAEQGNASQQRLEQDQAAVDAANATLERARAASMEAEAVVASAQAHVDRYDAILSETEIAAPTAGRVLFRIAEPGEMIAAGGNILLLVDLDRIYMTIYADATSAGMISVGEDALIWLDAYPGRPFPARVTFVASEAEFTPKEVQTAEERQNLVFRIKIAALNNDERLLKPGMPGIGLIRTDANIPWPQSPPQR
jgi:HlyD family secretion protein